MKLAQDNKLIRSLIDNSRVGNRTAFEQLYKMYVGFVHAISLRLLADISLANDNTSKVFVEAWKTIKMVRRDSPFILWLTAITVFSALEKLRNIEKNEVKEESKLTELKLSPFDLKILSLPVQERIPFVLKEIQHYNISEIKDLLNLSASEVEEELAKAKNKLISSLLINTPDALTEELNNLPLSIEPDKDLFAPVFALISDANKYQTSESSTLVKSFAEKSSDSKPSEEKKTFSFKDIFKKKK